MTSAARAAAHSPRPATPMGMGMASPSQTALPIAAEHFAAATLFLLAGSLGLFWIAPELAAGLYPSPHVAGLTHLFTLGWLTTTIFGALYQLLPVALGAPVRSVKLGHASFWTFAPGVALFATGVITSSTVLHHAGAALLGTGIAIAITNFGLTLARARSRDVTWAAVAMALAFLASTLVLGIVLLQNIHTDFLAEARLRVLAVHLHVALVGWVLIMMVGVSHRLLPMFLLAHGADVRWTRRSLALLAPGVLALVAGLGTQARWLEWTGAALIAGGVAAFVRQARAFHRVRVRRRIDVGMKFAATALGFLLVATILGLTLLARGAAHQRLATSYVLVGLLGGIVLYVEGFFYKIVPLLSWTVRYRGRMGKAPVPAVAELLSARLALVQLILMSGGVLALALGVGTGMTHCVRAGAALWIAGMLVFVRQLAGIALGRGGTR